MSFSSNVKNEITKDTELNKEETYSLMSAVMKSAGTLSYSSGKLSFKIVTENPSTARFIFKLLKDIYKIHGNLMVKKAQSFKKNNIYILEIVEDMGLKNLLIENEIIKNKESFLSIDYSIGEKFVSTNELKKQYIKGAFLGSGSVSDPEKSYHMEFVCNSFKYAKELSKVINSFNLNSKVIERKNSYIVYLKEGEQISDMLTIIGAVNSLFKFENVRVMKDMRNNVNRLVNCETANLSKTVNAAVRQVGAIRLIEKEIGLDRLSDQLREVAEIRLENPDESLKDIGEKLNPVLGKSGVNHRLRKIEKIADEIKRGGF
ncbi:MAG: DNA-binding protein WhiA [Clostridium sp.]|nr:DNA-binding protein WhiA [Clostridium sp.]